MTPTDEQFRQVGKTGEAAYHRLSQFGLAIIAQHNGVPVDKLPETFKFASNYWMQHWLETLGFMQALGYRVRDDDKRWWSPARMQKEYGHGEEARTADDQDAHDGAAPDHRPHGRGREQAQA